MVLRRALANRIYYGWVVAFACLLASMAVFGTTYAFGVFYDAFIDEFAVSRTAVATAFGLQTALIYLGGVAAGRLVDRIGGRRVAALSAVLLAGGLAWSAAARSFPELLVAFGVVAALGMAGLYVVGYATVPLWFERRRGTAAGFASAGLGVGLVVVPPGADLLIDAMGWRTAMLAVAGGVGLLAGVVALLFADDPSDVGADTSVEFGEREESGESEADGDSQPDDGEPATTAPERSPREIVRSLPFVLVFLGWTLAFAPMYALMSHIVVHAAESGIGRSTGVLVITVVGITTTASRLGIGALSDRLGRTRTFVVSAVAMGAAVAGIPAVPGGTALLALAVVFGVGYGGSGGLLGPQVADLFGDAHLNTLFAVMSVSFAVSGLLSPPLAGYVFETAGSYDLAFLGLGLSGVAGAGCVALAGRLVE
ncbi:MFS transporter [Halorubrum gandharaense]